MFYLYSDFALLIAAAKKKNQRLSQVFTTASVGLQFPLSSSQLVHALTKLRAGGYIDFSGDEVRSDLVLSVTDKGFSATKTGLFAKQRSIVRLEAEFCNIEIPSICSQLTITEDEYNSISRKLHEEYSVLTPFVEGRFRDGKMLFSFRGASPSAVEDEDGILKDSLDLYVDNCAGGLLAATCDFLLVSSKVRKFTLVGDSGVYIFSLSYVKDGARLTAAKILYNKQRFIGKRDSDLDYAQCGENVLDITIPPALLSAAVLRAYSSAPEILDDSMRQMVQELRASGI